MSHCLKLWLLLILSLEVTDLRVAWGTSEWEKDEGKAARWAEGDEGATGPGTAVP